MRHSNRFIFLIAVVVSLGGFIFGFDASVISGVVGYVTQLYGLDVWQQGLVVSAPSLAAILASLTVVPLSDVVGRRRMLIAVAFLYLVSAVFSTFAPGFVSLVIARAIGGLAFGSLMITPIYVAEIAPARLRGVMVSVNQMNIVVGLSAAYFCNYLLVALSGRSDPWILGLGIKAYPWRWMLGLEILPAAIWLGLLFLVPESPRWLVVQGRVTEARAVLRRMVAPEEVEPQLASVLATMKEAAQSGRTKFRQLISRELRFALFIGVIVAVAQQITGINAVFFFATSIFEKCGIGRDAAFAQAVWVGVINVVFTIVAMVLIDRLGRRPLLIGGLAGVVVSMAVAGYGFHHANYMLTDQALAKLAGRFEVAELSPLKDHIFTDEVTFKREVARMLSPHSFNAHEGELVDAAIRMNPFIVLAGILGFVASFSLSLGPVMWVVLSEIFPNHIRGLAMASIGFLNAGVSFLVQFLFPWELANLGNAGTFWLYGAFGVIGFVLVMRFMPETKGRTLEELQRQMQAR
jgi:SP family arabinose:H+ symporter-like MFS transporter